MANQTAARDARRQEDNILPYKQAAVDLFAGEIVSLNAAGFAKKGADTASEKVVGVADKTVRNSTGAAGAKEVRVWTYGVFTFAFSGTATQADTGKDVFVMDSQTVALAATATNDIKVGSIVEVLSATSVRVRLIKG